MSITSEQRAAAERALSDLEKTRRGALNQVLTSWDASGSSLVEVVKGGSSKTASVYYFETIVPAAIASLRRQLDLVGTVERWNEWVNSAEQLHRDMASVVGYSREWSWGELLRNVTTSTAQTLGQGAAAIGDAATSGTTWGVLAFGLAAFVAWKAGLLK